MTAIAAVPSDGAAAERWRAWRRVIADPLGLTGLALVALIVASALLADLLAAYSPTQLNIRERMEGPSLKHLFGTDHLGRDLFARVLHGGRIALVVSLIAVATALTIGVALGLLAGYGPRWLDNGLILVFDAIYSFPGVILGAVGMAIVGPSMYMLMLVVVIIQTPAYARLVRTATLAKKNSDYILAERSLGAGPIRILVRHILPNIVGPLFIIGSMDIPTVVTLEAGLTYLGLGLPPPAPSWGRILEEGYRFIRDAPWIVVAGGIPLIITTLGFTFLGESLRDMLDPKLRRIV
jgi:peptide/nickel transport system permease protein